MLYLPETTEEAVYMEAPNPNGSKKWWIGAYAPDGRNNICFTCWGNHENLPTIVAQGKTLKRGPMAKNTYRQKLEEKELKGYYIIETFDGKKWSSNNKHPLPQTKIIPGQLLGTLTTTSTSGKLILNAYSTSQGYRIDQWDWDHNSNVQTIFPDWQTIFPTFSAASTVLKSMRDARIACGHKVLADSIPWHTMDRPEQEIKPRYEVLSGSIQWDF